MTTKLKGLESLKTLDLSAKVPTKVEKSTGTIKRDYKMVKPQYLRRLYDKLESSNVVGEKLGVTGGTVANAIREDQCTSVLETAAMGVWLRDYEPKPKAQRPPLADNEVLVALRMRLPEWDILREWFADQGISATVLVQE